MKLILAALLTLNFAAQPPTPARAARQARHTALTLVSRVTVNRADGKKSVSETTRYVSADGSVREITREADGKVSGDYLYESGRGAFYVSAEQKTLTKTLSAPPEASGEPPPTAEQLRAAPNFVGTEQLLGYTAYIIRETHKHTGALDRDHYFAPELGRTPLKTVRYSGGKVFVVSEPVSVTPGEPEAALLRAPEGYEVRPMRPISGGVLDGKVVSKPNPVWPAGAREVTGTVTVQILVDEEGKVVEAKAVSGPEPLRQAAVDAAFKARLSPTRLSGQPVKVSGTLVYNFFR
jgi:TonB family protein